MNQARDLPFAVIPSSSESSRFGRPVARMTVDATADVSIGSLQKSVDASNADVIVLRYPSHMAALFGDLTRLVHHQPIFADCLLYWDRRLSPGEPSDTIADELSVDRARSSDIGELVRPIFVNYPSHYSANPLFDPSDVLDGYVEWVTNLVQDGQATCLVLNDQTGGCAGFAVIDTSDAIPDIRFGGISPDHRGRGYYGDLIRACTNFARTSGAERIAISTQVHNVAVMSTWVTLKWTPKMAVTTVHLVRRECLSGPAE